MIYCSISLIHSFIIGVNPHRIHPQSLRFWSTPPSLEKSSSAGECLERQRPGAARLEVSPESPLCLSRLLCCFRPHLQLWQKGWRRIWDDFLNITTHRCTRWWEQGGLMSGHKVGLGRSIPCHRRHKALFKSNASPQYKWIFWPAQNASTDSTPILIKLAQIGIVSDWKLSRVSESQSESLEDHQFVRSRRNYDFATNRTDDH